MSTESMVTQAALEPCPFCGGEPGIIHGIKREGGATFCRVYCGGCQVRQRADHPNRAEAIAAWNTRTAAQPEREAVLESAANVVESRRHSRPDTPFLLAWNQAMDSAAASIRALKTTPAPAEDDDPDDHLGGKLAAAVERELDRIEQRNSTRQDFTPAFDRELASEVIMAGFGLFGCRGGTTASGYQWMGLLEALGLDKARPVSAAPAVSRDEIAGVLIDAADYLIGDAEAWETGAEHSTRREYLMHSAKLRRDVAGRARAILSRIRGEG